MSGTEITKEQQTEFLCAFATTILVWQYVENEIFMIFNTLLAPAEPEAVSAAFYAVINFQARLSMVNEAFLVRVQENTLRERWEKLHEAIGRKETIRNKLAHLSETIVYSGGKPTLKLMPTTLRISSRKHVEHDVKHLLDFADQFRGLSNDLLDFQKDIAQHLGRRPMLPL